MSTNDPTLPRAPSGRSLRIAAGLVPALGALLGLGFGGASGCGDATGNRDPQVESAGEAQQAAGATPVSCLNLTRGGVAKVADAQLSLEKGNTSFGAVTFDLVGANGLAIPDQFRSLIRFDLKTIPADATVLSATLTLNQVGNGNGPVRLHLATAPWDEATVTWNSFGGAFVPAFFKTFSTAPAVVAIDVTPQVQAWVSGATVNHGILFEQAGATQTKLKTFEFPVPGHRPVLNLCFKVICPPMFADCNGVVADGCETNLGSAASCGACGNVCPTPPHASAACAAGACGIGACDLGFGDCDGNPLNGCETDLTTPASCGACGVACALPNAATTCAAGSCKLLGCEPGFFDCDGNPADGCEPSPCADGGHCVGDADCANNVCLGGFCAAAACNDHAKNGDETDLDCGGSCPPCADGLHCAVGGDCQSASCVATVCAPANCGDGVKNGSEADVDCGGPSCAPCGFAQQCAVGADCQSGVCLGALCQGGSCGDGVKNGTETGIDCGGACAPCASGVGCALGADCQSGVCLGNVCQMASCTDLVKNGGEADVDCGGPCPACNANQLCNVGADCASQVCVAGHCQPSTCGDGVKNGNETGVDCGGDCAVAETCNGVDDDCNGTTDDGLGTITCGVGACQVTIPACVFGQVPACVPGAPQVEVCDGALDDDCDGVVDNGCVCANGATQPCYSGSAATQDVGACHAGVQTCALGSWGACVGEVTPTAEACNSVDDDCNGATDEGLGSTICGVGACQGMVQSCVNGQAQACVPGAPQAESCNGLDDDCNGVVDDNLPTITCGVGACQVTVAGCVNGQPGVCVPGAPGVEACDGLDNDCNGQTDEGDPGFGIACNSGAPGACSAGLTSCAGGQIVCAQTVQPVVEVCDGLDNDCDGQVDDGSPGAGAACATGLPGVCGAGTTVCSNGQVTCNQTFQPTAEVCDGLDNTCDGQSDEGNPGGGAACATGLSGVCGAGTVSCAGGQIVCAQTVQSGAEVCGDALDNDCDGQVDQGCGCADGATQPCYGGPPGTQGVGACVAGVQTCAGGVFGACVGAVTPSPESCNGADDDCNGAADDGLGTISCGVGACAATAPACVNGQPGACAPGAPTAEVCDGLDNDCNGAADDSVPSQPCVTGLPGVCSAGATACVAAANVCVQTIAASASEDCGNVLDDTCNGVVNEGCVCAPNSTAACYSGAAGTSGVGLCKDGVKTCNAAGTAYGACVGEVVPVAESCGTVGDDNCNGAANEGCVCVPFTTAACYTGPGGTQGVGLCKAGTKTCAANGLSYGACVGQVVPAASESCHTVGDDNCNGQTNEGCAATTCALYTETFDPSVHAQSTAHYKTDFCNETLSPSFNMPACAGKFSVGGMRTNGSASSAQLWVYRGTSSCTSVKISYNWYQFAQSTSSLQYLQNSDSSFATCPNGVFTTVVAAAAQSALQTCSSTNNVVIPFSADPNKNSVYIKFTNGNASNNAMWYDNVVVELVGCPCN